MVSAWGASRIVPAIVGLQRVWRNRTAAPKDRTVEVRPTGQTFPAGSTVTVFTAPVKTEGHAPPAGAPGVAVGVGTAARSAGLSRSAGHGGTTHTMTGA